MEDLLINIGIYLAYGLIIVGTLAAILFPLFHMIKDPKSVKRAGIALGAVMVVFGISYSIAGGEVLPSYIQYGTTSAVSKLVSTGLITMYLLCIIAVFCSIFSEISKLFK